MVASDYAYVASRSVMTRGILTGVNAGHRKNDETFEKNDW
jgi:hypothetical protein